MNRLGKKQNMIYIIVLVLLVLFLAVVGYSCGQELAVSEYENHVNRIKEMDSSKMQTELNALVEKGKMNVNYSSCAIFKGKVSESFNIKNIKNNHYPIVFEILNENGDCLYQSKKIQPGYELSQIELKRELPKGTYNCKLKVGYAEEGNVFSAFPITIEVRE